MFTLTLPVCVLHLSLQALAAESQATFSKHKRGGIRCSCYCWLAKVIFTSQDWDTKLPLGCWMAEEASLVSPPVLEGPLLSVPCWSSPWFRLQKGQNSGTLVFKESYRFMVGCCSSPHNMLVQLCAHVENDRGTLGWGQGWYLHPNQERQWRHGVQQNLEEQQDKLQQACRTLSSGIAYGSRDTCVCKKRTLPPLQTQTVPFLRLQSLYPRFLSMQLDRKTHFSVTKWVRVALPPQRRTCTTLTSICFEAYHANAAVFPSRDPTAGSRPAVRSRILWYVSRHRCTKRP